MGKEYASDLSQRLLKFSVETIKLVGKIKGSRELDVVRYQLSKSATSIGANFEESRCTTKNEFPAKIRISVREALETAYWFRLIRALNVTNHTDIELLLAENIEIIKILKSILRKTSIPSIL